MGYKLKSMGERLTAWNGAEVKSEISVLFKALSERPR